MSARPPVAMLAQDSLVDAFVRFDTSEADSQSGLGEIVHTALLVYCLLIIYFHGSGAILISSIKIGPLVHHCSHCTNSCSRNSNSSSKSRSCKTAIASTSLETTAVPKA